MIRHSLISVGMIAALALAACGPSEETTDTPSETSVVPAPLDTPIALEDLPPDEAIPAEEDGPPESGAPSPNQPVGPPMPADPGNPAGV